MAEDDETRTVYAQIPYVFDKELHVSAVQSPKDGRFADIREYIPSRDFYGRGVTLPMGMLDEVIKGLEDLRHDHGLEQEADDTQARKSRRAR